MDDVLIHMKMPRMCYECDFCIFCGSEDDAGDFYKCFVVAGDENPYEIYISEEDAYEKRAKYCPLILVQNHGDLIDRDALIARVENGQYCTRLPQGQIKRVYDVMCADVIRELQNAPTVIPASKDEI